MQYRELIERMTLEEKASLTSGLDFWHTKPIPRLGVPSMLLTDGPHGLRKQAGKADHIGLNRSVPATCYPSAAGLANSWDEALIERMGEYLGLEAAAEGVSVLLGPGCNIKRNPLCGRNFEYFSEDPYLSGKMAAALIRGVQKNGVAACVKHFAANSQELLRMSGDSVLDERTLRELYLCAFETAVKEGGVQCVMSSYNRVNGVYANENPHLLSDILRGDWGYKGMVVSDWGGNSDRVAALIAGGDLEMPSTHGDTDRQIVRAVRDGRLDEAVLDVRVDAILDMIFSTQAGIRDKRYDPAAHHAFAAEVALETAVLLKNEDALLPLRPETRVAVIGDFARTPRYQGAGSSRIRPTRLENGLDALKSEGLRVVGFAPGFLRGGGPSKRRIREACALAAKADVALLWLGLDEGGEAEGVDREDMRLPGNQIALLQAVAAVNPRVAIVLSCGCAVEMEWDVHAKAVLHGYLGGQAGAPAIAALLTGRANPSGKLAETVPIRYEDVPSAPYYPGREATAEYREGLYVGYRYFDTAQRPVKYPFGHGLSYTSFAYDALSVEGDTVSFDIRNTGPLAGAEVAELYVRARTGGMFRPEKELKGFARVYLAPGESRRVSIALNERAFAVWSVRENGWVVESGAYELLIGASSADIRLTASIEKTGAPVGNPYADAVFAPYYTADVQAVPDASFRALLGRDIPPAKWDRAKPLGFDDAVMQGQYLKGGPGRALYGLLRFARGFLRLLGQKAPANGVMLAMSLPYRGLARMSGMFTDAQMRALLMFVNRQKGACRAYRAASAEKRRERTRA